MDSSGSKNWKYMTSAERVAAAKAAATAVPDGPPDTVDALKQCLADKGWTDLDPLVAVPEGVPAPTVLEWCGLALAAIPTTSQGAARYDAFEQALAKIALPGMQNRRSAVARMKEAGKAWQHRVDRMIREGAHADEAQEFEDITPIDAPHPLIEIAEEAAAAFEEWIDAPVEYIDTMVLWSFGGWGVPRGCAPTRVKELGGAALYPYLWITSVDPGSGKSTVLRALTATTRRPVIAHLFSGPLMYRLVEAHQPTLLLDEIGGTLANQPDVKQLLDSAYGRDGVVRKLEKVGTGGSGETFAPKAFYCFTPIALCGLGRLTPTIRSRSIRLRMRRPRAGFVPVADEKFLRDVGELRSQLAPHLAAHAEAIAEALGQGPTGEIKLPSFTISRIGANWRQLMAVAELIGGEWPQRCHAAAARLGIARDDDDESSLGDLLDAVKVYQAERAANYKLAEDLIKAGKPPPVQVSELMNHGTSYDAAVPLEFVPSNGIYLWLANGPGAKDFAAATGGPMGRPLTPKAIASLLIEADIPSIRYRRQHGNDRRQLMGYELANLQRAWDERVPIPVPGARPKS
jgi:hypothetical protein